VQRGTVHVVTADDCLVLRPLAQPILTQQLYAHRDYRGKFDGVDLDKAMAYAHDVLSEQPLNTRQLRQAFAERFPDHDSGALAFACRNLLPFIQVPPRGLWSRSGEVVGTTAEAWLGRSVERNPQVAQVIERYVAAFGPATVQDAATWSRYTGLREVFERLRPQLRTYRDEAGREYFDVPHGAHPDPDTPAPVRLLPQFDNVLLSHADRSRFVTDEARTLTALWMEQVGFIGTVLVDGKLAGMWRIDEPKRTKGAPSATTMTVTTVPQLVAGAVADVAAEAERLLELVAPGAHHDLRLTSAAP
jgi:DNA glycosylase AlkZ-like